jgi:hypothetical protein
MAKAIDSQTETSSDKLQREFSLTLLKYLSASIGIGALAFISTWVLLVRGNASESTDKLLALMTGLSVLFYGLVSLGRRFKVKYEVFFAGIAIASILVGIYVIENKPMSKEHPMGFGPQVLVLTLVLIPLLPNLVQRTIDTKRFKFLWIPFSVFIFVSVLLAFIQWNGTLVESAHSEYVVNEILSEGVGNTPYVDFIPQYSYLLSWLFAPIVNALSADAAMQAIIITLSVGSIFCLGLVLWLSKQAFPRLPYIFIVVLILAFTTPTPGWNRTAFSGPISTLLSGPSIRVLGGFLTGASLYWLCLKIYRSTAKIHHAVIASTVGTLVAWNNFDFGIASLVTALIVLFTFSRKYKKSSRQFFKVYILSIPAVSSILLVLLGIFGGFPNLDRLAWFSRQFGGGFGSVTISVPGPVLVNFPVIFGIATFGTFALVQVLSKYSNSLIGEANIKPAILASFFGIWSILCLPYYLNRSYQAGQMSIEYLGLAVALVATFSLVYEAWKNGWKKDFLPKQLVSLIMSFAIATVVLLPNITMEWDRLNGGNPNGTIPRPWLVQTLKQLPAAQQYANENGLELGFYGENGNFIEKKYGVESMNLFNNPLDMFQSQSAIQEACNFYASTSPKLILLTDTAKSTFAWNDGSLCEGLFTILSNEQGLTLAERRN